MTEVMPQNAEHKGGGGAFFGHGNWDRCGLVKFMRGQLKHLNWSHSWGLSFPFRNAGNQYAPA
jgi:hypothetical protein